MRNKRFGILVLLALLSLSNCAIAENINFDFGQDTAFEKIKANKDTILKAQEAMDNKDYQTAVSLLTAYINEKPKKYEAYKLRGDAYYAIRRYYMAQKDYQTAIDIKSSEDKFMTNTKYVSAIVLGADKNEQKQNAELGDLYGALMYAQKAMNNPNYTASYDSAVKYNSHIYLPQPNKNEINKINCPQKYGKVLTPQGIDIQIYGAIDDIAKGNYNESLYKLQSVTTQYPNYYLGHYLTGVALSELEKDDDAIREFGKAISLNPYDFESRASLGRIYYSKAETKFSETDARKSIEYFSQALRQNHNCPTYYFYIGMNELQIGNTNVAISNFDKALKINPSDYNSQYYKLIAQYINGNYQDVIDGASKLLLKHVSNYNSVLYLRALAYTKLNENEKALEDLNTIENNIGDIYNADIKTTSAREKSLESYVHYLKAQIQHSKGAGSAEDNTIAYSNPIIDRLSNAQKAIEPYEKTLYGESISLSDYNKFESFYSTSLPKLLESGVVITYEDIDNQYDYIRTTFADLGISFLYLNPDYKMTTIKDYPYKKYSSKLNRTEMQSLSARPVSDSTNVELARAQSETLRKSTPSSELILQENQSSLAQMLASDALAGKPKPMEVKNPIALRDVPVKESSTPSFKPENPDAEKVYSSKNIA
ncbi:tetratricopeptide repeat protein, partial [bacterium]|nr:tetratricopeptide repeat protein [bacterium]